MTDTMTPEQRHRCMAQIRSKGTKPEMKVRQWLWLRSSRRRKAPPRKSPSPPAAEGTGENISPPLHQTPNKPGEPLDILLH